MTVFKNYFKIVKQYRVLLFIYIVIFSVFAVMAATSGGNQASSFVNTKPKVTILDHSQTTLSKTFRKYMEDKTESVDLKGKKREDALFYREVDAVIEIPKDFTLDASKIKVDSVPDSAATALLETQINTFFETALLYEKAGMDDDKVSQHVLKDLKTNVDIQFLEKHQEKMGTVSTFFNFINYVFLALTLCIVSMIMSSYLDKNIRRRNIVSAYSYKKMNFELFLGNAGFTLLLWVIFSVISIVLYKETMFTPSGLLILLNFFIFGITALSIAFLIGSFIKNKEAQNGIANVVALGSSFIAGSFVPQEYLGAFVLGIAKFTPSYWFVKNNIEIGLLSHFSWSDLMPIFARMGVLILFAVFFFVITNVISRQKRKS